MEILGGFFALYSIGGLIFSVWMVVMFLKLCARVKRLGQNAEGTVFYYIGQARTAWFEKRNLKMAEKYFRLSLYCLEKGKMGLVPSAILEGYDGSTDFETYVRRYICDALEKLAPKQTTM